MGGVECGPVRVAGMEKHPEKVDLQTPGYGEREQPYSPS
jgi:hypothetical protein